MVAFFKTLPEMPAVVQSAVLSRTFLSPTMSENILQALRVSSTKSMAVLALAGLAIEATYILVWRWLWKNNIKGGNFQKNFVQNCDCLNKKV